MKTKAAILFKTGRPLKIEEVEIPSLKKGQLLVKILASGLCRSQLNEIKGIKGPDKYLPHMLGHEASAEIVEVGKDISKVKKGDYVALTWIKGKGIEAEPPSYKLGKQVISSGPLATFCQYAIVSENRVIKIPKKVPVEYGAIIGCAVATGIGIIRRTLKASKGKTIAIFGVGGIGSSAILGAKMQRCSKIIAVDIRKDKLILAKKLGATDIFKYQDKGLITKIKALTYGGVNFAVEASGVKDAMETAFEVLNEKGYLAIAGNLRKSERICLDPFEFIKGKRVTGTWGGETVPDIDIPFYAQKFLAGELAISKLVTREFSLTEINKAFAIMESNKFVGRMIIKFD